ncbi:MAG: phosphoribosylformylglycinamidine cyclo-ligase [Methanolinea sp.]|nr:phosphoribosylformylglycinamidine cyclo-ligase [Methanolinea sp.]
MGKEVPRTYRDAGVDIDLEARAVAALVAKLTFRREGRFRKVSPPGHFAGYVECGSHVLALTVDGVGTKMKVAERLRDWTTVGIDCIAMNANDLYVMNIEPVAFVDYIAADALSEEQMAQIGIGLNEGARQANVDIVGGETATLKGLVTGIDLAGTCLGIQRRERVISGERIVPGDVIVGVPSSGIHSNGLSLARRIVDARDAWEERIAPGKTIGQELLVPTRIYAEALEVAARTEVHGMCHITGGGLLNLTRLSRHGFEVTDPLPPHGIFAWLQREGGIGTAEMYRTFNMGMGYAYIVPDESADEVLSLVPGSRVVGEVSAEPGVRVRGIPVR